MFYSYIKAIVLGTYSQSDGQIMQLDQQFNAFGTKYLVYLT